jgi:hypothetical protein
VNTTKYGTAYLTIHPRSLARTTPKKKKKQRWTLLPRRMMSDSETDSAPLQNASAAMSRLQRQYQQILDRLTPHVIYRWLGTAGLVCVFLLRVLLAQGVSFNFKRRCGVCVDAHPIFFGCSLVVHRFVGGFTLSSPFLKKSWLFFRCFGQTTVCCERLSLFLSFSNDLCSSLPRRPRYLPPQSPPRFPPTQIRPVAPRRLTRGRD